ncbi:MAG: hypothetical protein IJA47_06955 [Oscillospiraceae bacterium]|nr:hypothetical protein [Oscillospiraceae bacterium]
MDTVKFLEWLKFEKSMGARSAKDVVSRCGRISRLLGNNELRADTIELLKANDEFQNSSTFIRSQLKRAVSLYIEFEETQIMD